jgi:hypothetical protein
MTMPERKGGMIAATLAGLAGGVAWIAGVVVLFTPAQAVLADPAYQSAKFLSVLGELEPLPRVASRPWLFPAGVALIGILYGHVYAGIRGSLGSGAWRRGTRFGIVAWALMAPWFEFYLPWNVMHEPAPLVLLELLLWAGVLAGVGLATAGTFEWMERRRRAPGRAGR